MREKMRMIEDDSDGEVPRMWIPMVTTSMRRREGCDNEVEDAKGGGGSC